jgi:hypothetical protein
MVRGLERAESHGRTRVAVRVDQVPPLVREQKARAGRLGALARWQGQGTSVAPVGTPDGTLPAGIQTLNPEAVPAWMRGAAMQGLLYRDQLQALLEGKEVLFDLAGATVDAAVMYKATLARGVKTRNPARRAAILAEARAWAKEHRACVATLASLAGDLKLPEPDPHVALFAAAAEEEAKRG